MKKRIRIHQAKLGMFVEEIEHPSPRTSVPRGRFLILSAETLEQVFNSRALSLLIDTDKGVNIAPCQTDLAKQEHERLLRSFSAEELREADRTLDETVPLVRTIVAEARMNGGADLGQAMLAVDRIMASARSNAAALIAVSRLKDKDQTTYLHSLAVSVLLSCFGRCLGFDEAAVHDLALGGLLHDIGKTAIPVAILAKPGALTPVELAVMRTHPRRSFDLLRRVEGMPQTVLDIGLYHHERYDGRGYPERLTGETIPLSARMAAICDVYEAMTTARPYKRASSRQQTMEMMRAARGHFDERLLGTFLSQLVEADRI